MSKIQNMLEDMKTYIVPVSVLSKPSTLDNVEYCVGSISDSCIRKLVKDPHKMIMLFVPHESVLRVHYDILTRAMNQKKYVVDRIALYAIPYSTTQPNYQQHLADIVQSYKRRYS